MPAFGVQTRRLGVEYDLTVCCVCFIHARFNPTDYLILSIIIEKVRERIAIAFEIEVGIIPAGKRFNGAGKDMLIHNKTSLADRPLAVSRLRFFRISNELSKPVFTPSSSA